MKKDQTPIFVIALFDFIVLNIISITAVYLKDHSLEFGGRYFLLITFFNFTWLSITFILNRYSINNLQSYWLDIKNSFKNIVLFTSFVSIFAFFYKDFLYSRAVIYGSSLAFLLAQLSFHYFVLKMVHWYRNAVKKMDRLLIIGNGVLGQGTLNEMDRSIQYNYKFVGFLDDKYEESSKTNTSILGKVKDAEQIFTTAKIDDIVITLPMAQKTKIKELISLADYHGIRVRLVPDFYKVFGRRFRVDTLGDIPVVNVNEVPLDNYFNALFKRIFDFVFSISILLLSSPFFLFICCIIKLNSKGSVFYKVERSGYKGNSFKLYKFRTMHHTEDADPSKSTVKHDPRITKSGKVLRKWNLDELPQFWNVLKGDMSVVGPRPHRLFLDKMLQSDIDNYMTRHYIRPGITGWAQVNGWRGPTETKEQREERTKHDLWYIHTWTFGLDIKIIFLTIFGKKTHVNAF